MEKGTPIFISVLGLHRDADYWREPLKWDPERFRDDNKRSGVYLPFGDGPRNCIGISLQRLLIYLHFVVPICRIAIWIDADETWDHFNCAEFPDYFE